MRYLLNRWGPIGVYEQSLDFPPDEYDYLVGPILTSWSVARAEQASAITCGMSSRATSGLIVFDVAPTAFADRLQAWCAAKNAGS